MEMEEQLAQIYQEIYQHVHAMIPEPWDKLLLYARMGRDSYSVIFYYYPQKEQTPIYSLKINSRFHIKEKRKYKQIEREIDESCRNLWQIFNKYNQDPWTTMTMWLESTGKVKIDYSYDDLSERDSMVDQIIWEYENLGLQRNDDFFLKYLDKYLQLREQGISRQEALKIVATPIVHPEGEAPLPQTPLNVLLADAIGAIIDKQLCFGVIIGNADWQINLDQGTIAFANVGAFPIQVIGTESQQDSTWLWGWANTASNIPDTLLQDARQLLALGQQQSIPELTEPESSLTMNLNGHAIASIASMICQADAYYRCPYEGVTLFVTIHQLGLLRPEAHPIQRVKTIFPQVVAKYPTLNHWRALVSYLQYYQLLVEETETGVSSADAHGEKLAATFDARDRLTKME